uniref:Uncharacterized protein n=1 Tax=Arundo donax TaxID=35708 RepID=A0A0A9FNR7_ARUDO
MKILSAPSVLSAPSASYHLSVSDHQLQIDILLSFPQCQQTFLTLLLLALSLSHTPLMNCPVQQMLEQHCSGKTLLAFLNPCSLIAQHRVTQRAGS